MPTNDRPRRGQSATIAPARARLSLSIQRASRADGLPATSTLRRWISRALFRDAEMTVRFVGAAEGRALNRQYRGRDTATNVLTFVYDGVYNDGPAGSNGPVIGDLVLCVPVLQREAREQKKTLRAHCVHLVVHGTLHLQGYDHENDKDARVMEALETDLLAALGYRDPYEETR